MVDFMCQPQATTLSISSYMKLLHVPVQAGCIGTEWINSDVHARQNSGDLHTGVKDGELWMKVEQVLVLSDSLLIRGDDGLF